MWSAVASATAFVDVGTPNAVEKRWLNATALHMRCSANFYAYDSSSPAFASNNARATMEAKATAVRAWAAL